MKDNLQTQGHVNMQFNNSRKITTVLASTCMLVVASFAQAGQYYEAVTINKMEGDRKGDTMTVNSWVDGDKSRVEFISGDKDGWMADGNYLVTVDGGENSYLVNPKEKTYKKPANRFTAFTLGNHCRRRTTTTHNQQTNQ